MSTAHRFYAPAGLVALDTAPPSPIVGETYFDTVLKAVRTWDGATWVSGTSAGPADAYTKTEADSKFVDTAGDTMIGPLVLASDPVADPEAATKRYVDAKLQVTAITIRYLWSDLTAGDPGPGHMSGDAEELQGMTVLRMSSTDKFDNPVPAVTVMPGDKIIVVNENRSGYGEYVVVSRSVQGQAGTAYDWIDYTVTIAAGSAVNPVSGDSMMVVIQPLSQGSGYIPWDEGQAMFVNVDGDRMDGYLKVPTPVELTDVANKGYVDAKSQITSTTVQYWWNDILVPQDPGSGHIAADTELLSDMQEIRMSKTDVYGNVVPSILMVAGDRVTMVNPTRTVGAEYVILEQTDNATWTNYRVTVLNVIGGDPPDGEDMLCVVYPSVGGDGSYLTKETADPLYVNVFGDTMTGRLVLSGDPIGQMEAATKHYVDTAASSLSFTGDFPIVAGIPLTVNHYLSADRVIVQVYSDTGALVSCDVVVVSPDAVTVESSVDLPLASVNVLSVRSASP